MPLKLGARRLAVVALPLIAACGAARADGPAARTQTPKTLGSPAAAAPVTTMSAVVVTASRVDLLGAAQTASQGTITAKEVALRPIFRVGQLYETVPGLVVTVHSGEGKANQYLLRGFNLDHGTDFASFVDAMPVNRPTNAHGQGYSDQNFLMPQIVSGVDFTKGPFFADIGDFGAVGSAHIRLTDELPAQVAVSVGTLRDQELFAGGTHRFDDDDRVWAALDLSRLDGPWSPPSRFRKVDATVRFSHGTEADGFSLTGMYYKGAGGLETDQPRRAVEAGLIGPYGALDPTDASRSERYSVSGQYQTEGLGWRFSAHAYAIRSTMTLWNNFTHFLDDEVNGDQEQQDERRDTLGGDVALTLTSRLGAIASETTFGAQDRFDDVYVDQKHTKSRIALDYCETEGSAPNSLPLPPDAPATPASGPAAPFLAVGGSCNADAVRLDDLGIYAENTTRWTSWLRAIVGLREERYAAHDRSLTIAFDGSGSRWLLQPKASIVFGPWAKTELYVSAGRGFHSDDVRGVLGGVPAVGVPAGAVATPLLAPADSVELGVRTDLIPKVQAQFAAFRIDFGSELRYDADIGQDQASAPSRRQGVEISAQYRPLRWLELNTDLAFSSARYRPDAATLGAVYGLPGPYVANAPGFIGSFGMLVDDLGPWFGAMQWRRLGSYALIEDDSVRDPGYSELNADVGYRLSSKVKLQVSVFNLLDAHANAAAFYYIARLPAEPAAGVAGLQVHPLEPRSARLTLSVAL